MSLKAGGTGLNLTAADCVILYEPWWNQAIEEQAIARAYRIGRKEPVLCKRYLVKDTIEEKMQELKSHKNQLIASLLDDEISSSISTEDLVLLIN